MSGVTPYCGQSILPASGVQPIGGRVGAARHCGGALVVQRLAGSLVSRIVGQGWLFADDASLQAGLGGGDQLIGRAVLAVVRPFEREAALHEHAVHLLHVERASRMYSMAFSWSKFLHEKMSIVK